MITERTFTERVTAGITDTLMTNAYDLGVTVLSVDNIASNYITGTARVDVDWGNAAATNTSFELEMSVSEVPKGHGRTEIETEFRASACDWWPLDQLWAWLYFRLLDERDG